MLIQAWKIIRSDDQFIQFKDLMKNLENEILNHEQYKMVDLIYLPREAYVECLLKVFYQIYYPTD